MIKSVKKGQKLSAAILTVLLIMQQSFCVQVMASQISGVQGTQNPNGPGQIFDIEPTAKNGDIGFRKYKNFDLSEQDIANLIFKYGQDNVEKFVNLVSNQVNIQGILNTMRDGNFYNGHAVFISPNGVVVGASGVLNVGSLSVLTPTQESFDKLKGDIDNQPNLIQNYESALVPGNGAVKIEGKVIARDLVDIKAADVNVTPNGTVFSGVNDVTALNSRNQAELLFNNLVNTSNMTDGNTFESDKGSISIKSYGADGGSKIEGELKNFGKGDIKISNSGSKGVDVTKNISNKNGRTVIENTGNGGIKISGIINSKGIDINNSSSDVLIGDNSDKNNYLTSSADVNINIQNGNLLNNSGSVKTLIKTTDNGNLNISVQNGKIGEEVGPCDGGICTGIGDGERDLTKSVNTSIDGKINAKSTGSNSVINMASLDKDMHIDKIESDGRVILLADTADLSQKGTVAYDVLNYSSDNTQPNVKGKGISIISSGNIGSVDKKLTFVQTAGDFNDTAWNADKTNYTPDAQYGVEMLAIKDINVKGLDNADGTKSDTNVCAMISKEGSINAEFSGDTYIREINADKNINLTTLGNKMYIENLGTTPTYSQDYYGPNGNVSPDRVKISALDLGTSWPDNPADSTVVIKNGSIGGDGNLRPSADQDLTVAADNVYVDGKHFHMGNDRNGGPSFVEDDASTNRLTNPSQDKEVSIRVKAVRPNDVEAAGHNRNERNYYYGGSSQGGNSDYDVDGNPLPDEQKGGENDDDNIVVPSTGSVPTANNDNTMSSDDVYRDLWKQRLAEDNVDSIDKRQYMRFSVENNRHPVSLAQNAQIDSLIDISRGGVAVHHNHTLKVGDVVPVKINYGNLAINTDVKVVTASDRRAGAEFINLDQATANKLLYMNVMLEEAETAMLNKQNLSYNK